MAKVQLKCLDTGEPVDIRDVSPRIALMPQSAPAWGQEVPCPHCGKTHRWTSSDWSRVLQALRDSPDATRVLVEGDSATALR